MKVKRLEFIQSSATQQYQETVIRQNQVSTFRLYKLTLKEMLDLSSMSFSKCDVASKDNEDSTNFALFIKDKFCLSDEAYHEMCYLEICQNYMQLKRPENQLMLYLIYLQQWC